jgi:hypothetical protein
MMRSVLKNAARGGAPSRGIHGTRSLAAGKDLYFGTEGRGMMLAGVDKLADAVQVQGR